MCWKGIKCGYLVEDVVCLCGLILIEYMLVKCGVEKLWNFINNELFVNVFGVLIGN